MSTQPGSGTRPESFAPLVAGVRREVDAWRDGGWAGVSATTRRLLEHWFLDEHRTADGMPFAYYPAQREAVETLVYLYEVARSRSLADLVQRYAATPVPVERQDFPRYVVKMATGSGKTKVMALAIVWSYFHRLREPGSPLSTTSLVVAPNLIVYERLRAGFADGRIFRTDPMVPPEWAADFALTVCLRGDPVPVGAPGVLALTNVQALYERAAPAPPSDPVSALLGARPPARLDAPEPLLPQLASRGRVLVVDDEAHHLHDEVKADTGEALVAVQTLRRLHELAAGAGEDATGVVAQFDFSATPRNQQGRLFPETVVDYPLASAIEDGIVKRPIIGEVSGQAETVSDDASVRYRTRLNAGVAKWREISERITPTGRQPLLFVMAEDTRAADDISRWMETLPDLQGRVLTIHVNMRGPNRGEIVKGDLEKARDAARRVDEPGSPYRAIVSVLMLREGWDVRNVCVIVPLRPYSAAAQILPEQTLGRGLRRMTPPGSGVDEQVVVVEHEQFRQLWDRELDEEGLAVERRAIDDIRPEPVVVAVEPERLRFDIEIPQLPRTLVRSAEQLGSLRVEDLPERRLRLADELRQDTVDYTGRDLLTREVVERATYPAPYADDAGAVLAWYAHEVAREARITGHFAVLAPLVRRYVETRLFGGPVDFDDPLVLQQLAEPEAREVVLGALREGIDRATLVSRASTTEVKATRLSATRPFLWSGELAVAERSVFSHQPCDSGFEVQFCGFLDRVPDVAAFAKLAREVRFSLEFRSEGGRLAYYYPDFVLRDVAGTHWVVEAKGLADLDVPLKDERAARWAADATALAQVPWRYLRVDQALFDRHVRSMSTFAALVGAVEARRRESYLARAVPGRGEASGILADLAAARARLTGVTGVDEEIARMREDPRA